MVMSFENQQVLNFLLEYEAVFTFRVKKRKTLGKDWINDGRGRKKIADVNIRFIKDVHGFVDLEKYVGNSGFPDLQSWLNAISDLAGEKVYNELLSGSMNHKRCGYLYRVSLRGTLLKESDIT